MSVSSRVSISSSFASTRPNFWSKGTDDGRMQLLIRRVRGRRRRARAIRSIEAASRLSEGQPRAFAWLAKAYASAEREEDVREIYRGEPRFEALKRRIDLP